MWKKIEIVFRELLLPAVVTCAVVVAVAATLMLCGRVADHVLSGERCLVEHPSMEHAP